MRNDALIFFVHVPKTAGSTVNAQLAAYDSEGLDHAERILNKPDELQAAVDTLSWMSAHVSLQGTKARLEKLTRRPIRYFSCVREPAAQVASHYNWMVEMYERGEGFYRPVPEWAKQVSEAVRASDYSVDSVVSNLDRFSHVFMNNQSKHLVGAGFDWVNGDLDAVLSSYEMVGVESHIGDLVSCMTGADTQVEHRYNASTYRFDASVFQSPRVKAFLAEHNTQDECVYRFVKQRLIRGRDEACP